MDFDPIEWIERAGVAEPARFFDTMERLFALLIEANTVTNLTRITTHEGFWIKHVVDSLLIAEAFPEGFLPGKQWLDLGCGGGFPSLVLAAAFPKIRITAMDSIAKKTRFVTAAGETLGFSNLTVITGRGREVCHKPPLCGKFDFLTARAVAEPSEVIHEGGKALRRKGAAVLYQTPEQIASESVQTLIQLKDAPWHFGVTPVQTLPMEAGHRQFLIGRKDF